MVVVIRSGHRYGDVEPFTITVAAGSLLQLLDMYTYSIKWHDYSPGTNYDLSRVEGSKTKVYLDFASG